MNKVVKNLFVLRSPLQMINALEAIEYFQLKNNTLIFIPGKSKQNKEQMQKYLKNDVWNEIINIKTDGKSKYFKYISIIHSLKKYRYKYLFLGELGVFHKILIPNIIKEKVFLLDDGGVTIKYFNEFIKPNKYNKYNFRELRFLLAGLKIKVKDKINLFTYYNIEPVNGIEVIKNRLTYMKNMYMKNIDKHIDKNIIYFIGQPLDTIDVISVVDYRYIIERIIRKYNKKIIYIPHRSESINMRSSIESIKDDLMEIRVLNQPIEEYFLKNGIYPSHIISCTSTALTTLGLIYDDCKIYYVKPPYKDFTNEYVLEEIEYYKYIDKGEMLSYDDLGIKTS